MTPQERQMIDDLFDRLARVENSPRDANASAAIQDGLRKAPNAIYALVQTVLVQDEALKRADARIQELEQAGSPQPAQSGGFLDTMRETIFGKDNASYGSVPNVPPQAPSRPVWNSGQALQQSQGGGRYDQGYGQPSYGQPPYGQGGYGQGGFGQGGLGSSFGGGSFLGTAAAAATGVVGGSLLLNGIRSMMGGSQHHAFGDTNLTNDGGSSPWSSQGGSSLASDAGINDIGRNDSGSRSGLFDQASNDGYSNNDGNNDSSDVSDDFGNDNDDDGGSDYA